MARSVWSAAQPGYRGEAGRRRVPAEHRAGHAHLRSINWHPEAHDISGLPGKTPAEVALFLALAESGRRRKLELTETKEPGRRGRPLYDIPPIGELPAFVVQAFGVLRTPVGYARTRGLRVTLPGQEPPPITYEDYPLSDRELAVLLLLVDPQLRRGAKKKGQLDEARAAVDGTRRQLARTREHYDPEFREHRLQAARRKGERKPCLYWPDRDELPPGFAPG